MYRGKKYRSIASGVQKKIVPTMEAFLYISSHPAAKFDESVEVHINTTIDAKKTDQQLRTAIVLPHGIGKTKRIAVITSTHVSEAQQAGAAIVVGEEFIDVIRTGSMDFDVLIATPEMMPKLASVAKILGPRGLMPNPKTETVTTKIADTIAMINKGKVDIKNDKTGNIHAIIGRVSFGAEKLNENFLALIDAVQKAKPSAHKGQLIESISLCSTMGPSLRVGVTLLVQQ